jgi:hypothetical protein
MLISLLWWPVPFASCFSTTLETIWCFTEICWHVTAPASPTYVMNMNINLSGKAMCLSYFLVHQVTFSLWCLTKFMFKSCYFLLLLKLIPPWNHLKLTNPDEALFFTVSMKRVCQLEMILLEFYIFYFIYSINTFMCNLFLAFLGWSFEWFLMRKNSYTGIHSSHQLAQALPHYQSTGKLIPSIMPNTRTGENNWEDSPIEQAMLDILNIDIYKQCRKSFIQCNIMVSSA